jgi:tRNA threonylcarbamoyladenosine biosynthesis protein TsaE
MRKLISASEQETRLIAGRLAAETDLPALVCLYGELGSGKTVFAKGLGEAVGIPARRIKSPTFTFQRRHIGKKANFYHFDFYRVLSADELIRHDLEEALSDPKGLVVAEWAENVIDALPKRRIDIRCRYVDENTRNYDISFPEDDRRKSQKTAR